MIDQNDSEIDVTGSSDTPNPWFIIAVWSELQLGCLDVPVSQKEARQLLVCGKKGGKWRRGGIRRKDSTSCR